MNLQQNYKTQEFTILTKEEIMLKAPQVYTEKKHDRVTSNYKFIPTYQLIDDMKTLGWEVVDAKSMQSKKLKDTCKHMVIFRNENVKLSSENGEVVYPQILLTNSHDGSRPFTFNAGLFRLVCSNGLVVSDKTFKVAKIRHIKYNYGELKNIVFEMIKSVDETLNVINKMVEVSLNEKQQLDYAKKAITIKLGLKSEKELSDYTIPYNELIKPKREADSGNNLWQIYNIIQENIINGGFSYSYNLSKKKNGEVKIKTARKINEIEKNISVNKELYNLALEYIN